MAECERLPGCPLFHERMEDLPFAAEQMKQKYCLGSSLDCARHQVFEALGKEHAPADLFPNALGRAERIITEAQTAEEAQAAEVER